MTRPTARAAMFAFVLCAALYALTMSPGLNLYHVDSPEFVVGAHTLGVIHAPGYPLYLLVAHLFTHIPLGGPAARVNALSVLTLALTAPLLLVTLARLTGRVFPALAATLTVMLSGYVWHSSVSAEIYAPQMLSLTVVAYLLARRTRPAVVGVAVGVALGLTPASVLLLPGFVGVLWQQRPPWTQWLHAGLWAGGLAVLPWAYFPLRALANPTYNVAGHYNAAGHFQPLDLTTLAGVWQHVSGGRFRSLYGATLDIGPVAALFAENLLWVGGVLVIVGGIALFERSPYGLLLWLVAFVPVFAFYATYAAADKSTMLGPGHLLLAVPVAYGWQALAAPLPRPGRALTLALIPLILISANLPIIYPRRGNAVQARAAATLAALPPHSVALGRWEHATPLQYLQLVENQRPDVTVYNLFLFSNTDFIAYFRQTAPTHPHPVVLLSPRGNSPAQQTFIQQHLQLTPLERAPWAFRAQPRRP